MKISTQITQANAINPACSDADMLYLNDRKAYVPIATCVLEHVLFTKSLSDTGKLFYLLADMKAHIHQAKGGEKREAISPGEEWSRLLNRNNKRSYPLQKELESAGYFLIERTKTEQQDDVNRIIPTLPASTYLELSKAPNQNGCVSPPKKMPSENRRSALDRSKLFTKINIEMYKQLLLNPHLTSGQKVIWLYLFARSYRSFIDGEGQGNRKFLTTFDQIKVLFNCAKSTPSKATGKLEEHGFLSLKTIHPKQKRGSSRKQKKSFLELEALFPKTEMELLKKQRDRANVVSINSYDEEYFSPIAQDPSDFVDKTTSVSKTHPSVSKTHPFNNKDIITKITLNLQEQSAILPESEDADAKVFSESTTEKTLLPIPTSSEAREALTKMPIEKDFETLVKAGLDENLAKTQSATRLEEHERAQLAPIALALHSEFCKNRKMPKAEKLARPKKTQKCDFSIFELMLIKEILMPKLRVLLSENDLSRYSSKSTPKQPEITMRVGSRSHTLLPSKDLQPFMGLDSLEPEALVGPEKAKQILYWLHAMRDREEIKGEARTCPIPELATQVAFHAKHWKPGRPMPDPEGFAIFVACQKIRAGTWAVPFEMGKAREAIWSKEKQAWA